MSFMNRIRPSLFDNSKEQILRNSTFWNLCASVLNSMMTALLLFFVMRLNGVDDAGLFSIASALAYQALTVGLFGVRNYHAADVYNKFQFSDYYYLRIITCIMMYGIVVYYAFFQGYTVEKASVVFAFSVFKSIDAIEDLYHGEYQRQGRLDIAAYLQTIRYVISLLVLVLLLFVTHNLPLTCLVTSALSLAVFIIQNISLINSFVKKPRTFRFNQVKSLLIATLPLCISTWLNIYILNAAKYSIDKVLSADAQAYYGTLVLPVFTINLLATVIYRPYITGLAEDWKSGNLKRFLHGCFKQLIVIGILTVVITAFGWTIGLKLLSLLYGMDLAEYMLPFVLLLVGGGLNTLAVFMTVLLTIQEKQNMILVGYILSFAFCVIFSDRIVQYYDILGASLIYTAASGILCCFYSAVFLTVLQHQKRRTEA